MPVSLKNIPDEAALLIVTLNPELDTFECDKLGSMHKAHLLPTKERWFAQAKVLVQFFAS